MIKISIAQRQRDILVALREDATNEKRKYIDRALVNKLDVYDIDVLCRIINDEYLMRGIEKDYSPNPYGRELETLLNTVNKPRLI
jgi:hypothetical protein